jgi:dual specificity MAP kinase phosphatase
VPNKFDPSIKYLRVDVEDRNDQPIEEYFNQAFDFIENALTESASNRVLVHCAQGVSRSASIVIMYLMRHYSVQFDDAYKFTKACREIVSPNQGFLDKLREFAGAH